MKIRSQQSGFTAIELLITLFVAAGFLVAGYQLFNVIIKDGGQARAESRAGNVAYDYIRRYSSYATDPCAPQTPLNDSSLSVDGLSNVKITVAITCPEYSTTNISKVEVSITYNNPQQTVKYGTLVTGSGIQVADVTDGLINWWKFNGNANTSVGTANGVVTNAILTQGQNGQQDGAYSFNGSNAKIEFPLTNFPTSMTEITVSAWIKPTSITSNGFLNASPDDTANRFNIHFAYTSNAIYWDFGNISSGGRLNANGSFNNAWLNDWALYTFTSSAAGGQKVYRNGTVILSSTTSSTFTKGTKVLNIGFYSASSWWWPGSVDDLRIYGRALSQGEIMTIYNGGAK